MQELIAGGSLKTVSYQNKQLIFHHADNFTVFLLSASYENILQKALQHFSERFASKFELVLQKPIVEPHDFELSIELINELLIPILK